VGGDEQMSGDIRAVRFYVLEEDDGSLGSVCIYQASGPEAIREHASRAGLRVDEIIPVADTVVVRPDPESADTQGINRSTLRASQSFSASSADHRSARDLEVPCLCWPENALSPSLVLGCVAQPRVAPSRRRAPAWTCPLQRPILGDSATPRRSAWGAASSWPAPGHRLFA